MDASRFLPIALSLVAVSLSIVRVETLWMDPGAAGFSGNFDFTRIESDLNELLLWKGGRILKKNFLAGNLLWS